MYKEGIGVQYIYRSTVIATGFTATTRGGARKSNLVEGKIPRIATILRFKYN